MSRHQQDFKWIWNRAGGVVTAVLLVLPGLAWAEGMQVKPGQWEIQTTQLTPMSPVPKVSKDTECVTESEMSHEPFLKGMQSCEVSDATSDSASIQWTLSCPNQMGEMRGDGRITSTGEAIEGSMSMEMNAGGMPMKVKVDWEGRRLGPC